MSERQRLADKLGIENWDSELLASRALQRIIELEAPGPMAVLLLTEHQVAALRAFLLTDDAPNEHIAAVLDKLGVEVR